MDTVPEQSRSRRRGPGIILLYIILQSLGAGLATTPSILFFRDIRYKECQLHPPIHIPEHDICNEQTNHRPDVDLYFGVIAVLSLLVSGPFGRLLDVKGRREVMTASGLLNACGDIWLYFCASVPVLSSNIYPAMLAALFKGIGGASLVVEVAHWSYIAFAAQPERRSTFFIFAILACWSSFALGVMASSLLRMFEFPLSLSFLFAFWCWAIYSLAAAGLLRDEPALLDDDSGMGSWTLSTVLRSPVEPFQLIVRDTMLGLMAISYALAWLAIDAFDAFTLLAVRRYGTDSVITGTTGILLPVIRNTTVLCILPLFVAFYRSYALETDVKISETTPLLVNSGADVATERAKLLETLNTWKQEATIQWASFFAGSSAIVLVILSKSSRFFLIGSALAGLSIPALPSILSMVALRTHPAKLGRVLTGFNMIQGATLVLPTIPRILTSVGLANDLMPLPLLLIASFLLGCGGLIALRLGVVSPKSLVSHP